MSSLLPKLSVLGAVAASLGGSGLVEAREARQQTQPRLSPRVNKFLGEATSYEKVVPTHQEPQV